MKKYIIKKKSLLILLGILTFFYLAFKTFTLYASAYRVMEFVFLTIFLGLAPAYFLQKVFRFENIIGWLVNSSVLGLLFIPFLFLIFGWVGFNPVFVYSVLAIYIFSIIGIISLFIFGDESKISSYINFKGITRIDVLFYIILCGITFILTLHNFDRVYPRWDAFTYWGIDAKYIFQKNQLRDSSLDVFALFTNTSYYPIYYSIIYKIYGAIEEQYASWINVYINFLALLVIYNYTLHKGILRKLFIVTILIIISYAADPAVFIFSMYADILCALYLLLYMVILTNKDESNPETYSKRMFLLLLFAVSLYFIKSKLFFLTIILIAVLIGYDIKFLLKNWRALIKRADFWLVISAIVTIYLMNNIYFTNIINVNRTPVAIVRSLITPNISTLNISTLNSLLVYTKELVLWLTRNSPYLVFLWFLGLCSILSVKNNFSNKKYLFTYFVSAGVFLIFCLGEIIKQNPLQSGSLIRYTAITMFLIPQLFNYIIIKVPRQITTASLIILFILSGYFFIKTMTPVPLYDKFTLSKGSYSEYFSNYSSLAENTLKITGEDSKILIADDFSHAISNKEYDGIVVRYFLMYNSVGGQYRTLAINLLRLVTKYDPDYILLLSYANTFDHCENIMTEGHNYLIKVDTIDDPDATECIFSKAEIVDLSK